MERTELLPEAAVYLWLDTAADPARFVRCFRATWLGLPWGVRRGLLTRWLCAADWQSEWPTPLILLTDRLRQDWPDRTVIGLHCPGKDTYGFHWPSLCRLTDAQLMTAMAHELAHGVAEHFFGVQSTEQQTHELTRRWGFRVDGTDGLLAALGIG